MTQIDKEYEDFLQARHYVDVPSTRDAFHAGYAAALEKAAKIAEVGHLSMSVAERIRALKGRQ